MGGDGLRPPPKSFNGKPKATVFPTGADAFGLPLNERAQDACILTVCSTDSGMKLAP
jgi:hypothetical protein